MATVLKTVRVKALEGSNPSLSAKQKDPSPLGSFCLTEPNQRFGQTAKRDAKRGRPIPPSPPRERLIARPFLRMAIGRPHRALSTTKQPFAGLFCCVIILS